MKNIEIITPKIFSNYSLISGVTLKNEYLFHPYGFSISQADILDEEMTENNLKLFAEQIGIQRNQIKMKKQIHSDFIFIVDENDGFGEGDALITNKRNLMLLVKVADCAGVLIYDPINNIIAAVHSGWRGTEQKILMKTIDKMYEEFGSNPLDLLTYISPCASGEKYEVGIEVARLFPQSIKPINENKFLFDNKNELKLQLLTLGVRKENIEISEICTIENLNCHSFRRDKDKSGRMGAFIMMK